MAFPTPATRALDVFGRLAPTLSKTAVAALLKVHGVEVQIYFPQANDSIYETKDNTYVYNPAPDYVGLALVTGIAYERFESDQTLDAYNGVDVNMYFHDPAIPNYSKVMVMLQLGQVQHYRSQILHGWYGENTYYLRRYQLIPIEALYGEFIQALGIPSEEVVPSPTIT